MLPGKLISNTCARSAAKGSESRIIFAMLAPHEFIKFLIEAPRNILATKAKATKKFNEVMTAALRLHPTKAELWLYAARWTLEQDADMTGARSYMQRGTRFCIQSKELWIEYAKLEMIYLAKIAMRRRILGLDVDTTMIEEEEVDDGADPFAEGNDVIAIPDIKTNAIRPNMIRKVQVDVEASKDPMNTPALNGAIPLAIYDAARKQPFFCAEAAESFFNMFSVFTQVRSLPYILQHVLDSMEEVYPVDACTQSCCLRQPIVMIDPTSAEFPGALAISLERLQGAASKVKDKAVLAKKVKGWIQPIISIDSLDPGVAKVLEHMLRRLE
ncbi:hypothetical protein B0O99DRAFT_605292 [Bisporella sp. PMI_857]|nr:hypothetical protein B0O99DRAFT_605292 [Bisporella sp. PMI_857]